MAHEDALIEGEKPHQLVEKIRLHICRHGADTVIEEVAAPSQQPSAAANGNTDMAIPLARMLGSRGDTSTQHVLQTVVTQVRNLER